MAVRRDGIELRSLQLCTAIVIKQARRKRYQLCITQQHRCGGAVYCQSTQLRRDVFWQCTEQGMQRPTPVEGSCFSRVGIGDTLVPDDGFFRVDNAGACAGGAEIQA